MEIKLFEIRDRATFIPVMAIKVLPLLEAERYLMARAGFGLTRAEQHDYTFLTRLGDGQTVMNHSPLGWGNSRTMPNAHRYIDVNWNSLVSGAVIDVEFILGETKEPKQSEGIEYGI